MSVDACAARLAQGDPIRLRASMIAPPRDRPALLALYAFNLDLARSAWVASEPVLAALRVQWWADTLEDIFAGRPPARHDVTEPLAAAIRAHTLPKAPFETLIAARAGDAAAGPTEDIAEIERFVDATAGGLMWLAALSLGAEPEAEAPVRRFARGTGLAQWLVAQAALAAAGKGLRLGGPRAPELCAALAVRARESLAHARRHRLPARLMPALLAGHGAEWALKVAPQSLLAGTARAPQARQRLAFATRALLRKP